MSLYAPLKPEDPRRLADYELLGRLGEGGQGVVYLAASESDQQVAIKLLRPEVSFDPDIVQRFLREARVAERVAAFCTAQVLSTGVEAGRPYIVSEYIEGPSLRQVIEKDGPRTGGGLHRLAVSTLTALAAIHQAGIVHRDFKPSNVIIAPDGPRVVDFGIARALDATSTLTSSVMGTPAYMSPEQFLGQPVEPAADLFSWASTMVYAATGRPPFGDDSVPAVLARVLYNPPEVPGFDSPLREVVIDCLNKDPARRPTLDQATRRLLQGPAAASGPARAGRASVPEASTAAPASGRPASTSPPPASPSFAPPSSASSVSSPDTLPPSASPPFVLPQAASTPAGSTPSTSLSSLWHATAWRRRRKSVLAALSAAALVTIGVTVPWGRLGATNASSTPPPARPSASAHLPSARPLPGTKTTVYDYPDQPIALTSYQLDVTDDDVRVYLPTTSGLFDYHSELIEGLVSPDGRYVATRKSTYEDDGYDSVTVMERSTGHRFTLKSVKEPQVGTMVGWSRDSSRILLNLSRTKNDETRYSGFAIIDVAKKTIKKVQPTDEYTATSAFTWDDKDRGVVNERKGVIRFFDENGNMDHALLGVGARTEKIWDDFSPSGALVLTDCPSGGYCVSDVVTGKTAHQFRTECEDLLGWYDDAHLYCYAKVAQKGTIQVIDFTGKFVRKLADTDDYPRLTLTYTQKT
ncbi:serine/threonine protein kinase [Nonomuraea fuscirosea]|uniref:serine/threonine protein kinase n=1 Tax=Nonomuraea fuscirosea TaxID=1291556 RepID=UPI0034035B36